MIDNEMKQYAMCSEDLNEIEDELQNMNENNDNYDQIVPGTQYTECQMNNMIFLLILESLLLHQLLSN